MSTYSLFLNKLLTLIILCLLPLHLSLAVESVDEEKPRETPDGYVTDSSGNIMKSSSGNCVKSGNWSEDDKTVVGCDDVTLEHEIKLIPGEAIEDGVLTLSVPVAELFEFDSAELSEKGKQDIATFAERIQTEISKAHEVLFIGHTDNTGAFTYNMELSLRRAQAFANHVISLGANEEIVRSVGLGPQYPIASNDTREGRAQNRRVEVVIIAEPRALDRFVLPSAVLFERRSAELNEEGQKQLHENIVSVAKQLARANYIEVIGHTDDVGTEEYNYELSLARANAVKAYMIRIGLNPHKIHTLGMGKSQPIATNSTEEGRQENRRVEIFVLGRTKEK